MEREKKSFSGGRKYSNKEITVYWKPDACVHASYCYRELIEVFDPGRRPWIDMEGSQTERIIEVVNMCPTEALSWKWNDEDRNEGVSIEQTNHIKYRRPELAGQQKQDEQSDPIEVKVMPDGPLVIKGDFIFKYGNNNKEMKDGLISLCRCGRSDHQPFCDGAHRKAGFEDKI